MTPYCSLGRHGHCTTTACKCVCHVTQANAESPKHAKTSEAVGGARNE